MTWMLGYVKMRFIERLRILNDSLLREANKSRSFPDIEPGHDA